MTQPPACHRQPLDDLGQRAIIGRHIAEHQHVDECRGCEPCPEAHCRVCGQSHDPGICPGCQGRIKRDLAEIVKLDRWLEMVALMLGAHGDREGGLPLGGEPMVLLGPVSPFAEDDEPAPPAPVVLIQWEYAIRWALDQPTGLTPTQSRAVDYICDHLADIAHDSRLDVRQLAEEVASARAHLEDVLHAGLRDESGVPCVRCGSALVRACHPTKGLADEWTCRWCKTTLSESEYRYAVGVAYLHNAPALTAVELEDRLGVKASVVRVWGSRGLVAKRGHNLEGRLLYDVADVEVRLASGSQAV